MKISNNVMDMIRSIKLTDSQIEKSIAVSVMVVTFIICCFIFIVVMGMKLNTHVGLVIMLTCVGWVIAQAIFFLGWVEFNGEVSDS